MVAGAPDCSVPPARLPAAATTTTSCCSAYRNAASQLSGQEVLELVSDMLMTWAPLSTAQRTAAGICSSTPTPAGFGVPSQVEAVRICALGATPITPSVPAPIPFVLGLGLFVLLVVLVVFVRGMPAPGQQGRHQGAVLGGCPMPRWPSGSPEPEASVPPTTAPFRSGWVPSTPLSITATFTPSPCDSSQAARIP